MIVMSVAVGQKIAIPLFMAIYLRRWAGCGWRVALCYALVGWAILVGFYDRIMHLLWYPSWLSHLLQNNLPAWLPAWLVM